MTRLLRKLIRHAHAHGYSPTQILVREATSTSAESPSETRLREIVAQSARSDQQFYEIVDVIDQRLRNRGGNGKCALNALKVLEYCLREGGGDRFVVWAANSIDVLRPLCEFRPAATNGDSRDVGADVRLAARQLVPLVLAMDQARQERVRREQLEEELRQETLRQERLQLAVRLQQSSRAGAPLSPAELEDSPRPAELGDSAAPAELSGVSSRAELPG
ncbi:hypothetical protein BJX64DRAFT_259497 [Aspergillus heterothallicus]